MAETSSKCAMLRVAKVECCTKTMSSIIEQYRHGCVALLELSSQALFSGLAGTEVMAAGAVRKWLWEQPKQLAPRVAA